ncbi:hypothetical protein Syun_009214 [Stephania yunnanensis]|uniref:DUF4283 domain-containing protein n=1 Tax=Stephania yunnanensis TaxID=152371 RepID=A0AAP0KF60_9MAGN
MATHRGDEDHDMDKEFYMVRFNTHKDYQRALIEGPSTVMGHYLLVQPWNLHFNPCEENLSKVAAWIRLLGLPF